ncbi:thioredoxin family protein [bacterium]|nr:thioredoxin family protein [bacterium]MBU1958955.1 thioredoxin family protein [bacterium]
MKKVALFFYLPVLLVSGELKDSLLKAKKEQKPIMVYVTAESCQYCDKMKDKTIKSASVQNNMNGFIFTVTDKEDAEAKKYLPSTRYTPTVYFISPKFKVVNTVKGYLGEDDFNLWIDDTKSKLGMNGSDASVVSSEITTQSDVWMYDIASAMDYANQTGKQVMVYVENSSSKWSKKMRKETFEDKAVQNALDNFVWVKLQKGSNEAKNNGYTPKLAPTVYFMRANGSALATAKGYFAAKDFLLWVNYAKSRI